MRDLDAFVAAARVDPSVFALRPDYRVQLIALAGIEPGPSDDASQALLLKAERHARIALETTPVDQLPHIAAWRDAYRAFGAKPQRTRNSVEALTRRASSGLPRVNRLTDIYNAISVLHELPLGGEDFDRYDGPPQLLRAQGDEPFDTVAEGHEIVELPELGEVIWRDRVGVTCRRWNWRQGRRTQLRDDSGAVLFILDALEPMNDVDLSRAADHLISHIERLGRDIQIATRLISGTHED